MSIQNISTANTFYQWVVLTQKLVPEVNDKLVNFTVNPLYSNTNINVAYGLVVGGNVNVGGTFILDQSNIDDLSVSGNLSVGSNITAPTGVFTNLAISSNLSNVSVNTTVAVGTNSNVYGRINVANKLSSSNLTATGNLYFHNTNVYASNVIVTTTQVNGNLVVSGNATFSNSTITYGNFETANITTLLNQSNTRIYSAIGNSRFAVETAANVAAMTAFVLALG